MKTNKLLMLSVGTLLAASVLVGCGKKKENKPTPTVESVSLDQSVIELVTQANAYYQSEFCALLEADVEVTNGASQDIVWTSSNTAVATVEDGLVVAVGKGSATITATSAFDSTKSASATINVVDPYVISLSVDTTGTYQVVGSEQSGSVYVQALVDTFGKAVNDGVSWESDNEDVAVVEEVDDGIACITVVSDGEATITATTGAQSTKDEHSRTIKVVAKAEGSMEAQQGPATYVGKTQDRLDILGELEKYVVDNHLGGLPFMSNGGYVMYADNVVKASNTYVSGYGFGILKDGSISGPLAGETNTKWKEYLHSANTEDPGSLNYMNDKGSTVGDLIGYTQDAYFDVQLNENKNGYDWVGCLSETDRPFGYDALSEEWLDGAVAENKDKTFKKFRFPVKVGENLKYATNSTVAKFAAFNNREAVLEDYITPYKVYYTQAFGLARSAENLTGSGSIKGSKAYYDASKAGFNADAWANIGIKGYEEGGKSYLEFEFNQACTPFYAMYYLSSGMYAPTPEEFIKLCGTSGKLDAEAATHWGTASSDGKESVLDHSLSTGPYKLELWENDKQIVWERNNNREYTKTLSSGSEIDLYQIKGVHMAIIPAAKQDREALFNEFLANKLSSVGIPSTRLDEYRDDPRTTTTKGDSNFKLNINSCDEETWEALFGVNGSITQTPKSNYWDVKPIMSNKNFLDGLSYAIDRKTLCAAIGQTPAFEYFSDDYMADPESGISYNVTDQHKAAIASITEGTDEFGYSEEKAKASFKAACDELIANGSYKRGDEVKIEIAWMYETDKEDYGNAIVKYFQDAFNSCGGGLTLKVDQWAPTTWSDVYYKKMMPGQYDLGFGSISGNSYDPLNFLEVLKSDNSSGFTLNWGLDTSAVDGSIVYDDKVWSFDALWTAADQGAYIENGVLSELSAITAVPNKPVVRNADGSLTVSFELYENWEYYDEEDLTASTFATFYGFCLFATTDPEEYSDYTEVYFYSDGTSDFMEFNEEGDPTPDSLVYSCEVDYNDEDDPYFTYTITISKECVDAWLELFPTAAIYGIDVYAVQYICGEPSLVFLGTIWQALSMPAVPAN